MYISIDRAQQAGLRILIEKQKDSLEKYLIIQPERGVNLETDGIRDQLHHEFGLDPATRQQIIDDLVGMVHHATIWRQLKTLDESEA